MYQAYRFRWLPISYDCAPESAYLRGRFITDLPGGQYQYEAELGQNKINCVRAPHEVYEISSGYDYKDMCEMDVLNYPEVLYNLLRRYKRDNIFTCIGPTLIIINPYRQLPDLFNQKAIDNVRDALDNHQLQLQSPHIYKMVAKAYEAMCSSQYKQAVVISGESGAGKTYSTKYCLQLLTSLNYNHNNNTYNNNSTISSKILACNPLLYAFGNSKTVRNDNSSRFGKFIKIFYDYHRTITGAKISSYLLYKSRVVSIAPQYRSFHVFYALTASTMYDTRYASYYAYLKQSNCYSAGNIDDRQCFHDVNLAMRAIGFTDKYYEIIWRLLNSILTLGNVDFDDSNQYSDYSKTCVISNRLALHKVAETLHTDHKHLEKLLLYERKKFLKEYTLSAYSKLACRWNRNTLSKAIYNSIFEHILTRIQTTIHPPQYASRYINILDIFGFEHFTYNTFYQLCINFTNYKLLKLYNNYVFDRYMQIYKQDDLNEELANIQSPTNDDIINLISGKLSLFSIINDLTAPSQFKDDDIIHGFATQLKNSRLAFDKLHKHKFFLIHTQCQVCYNVTGFKSKNQDKVNDYILYIVNNLFPDQNKYQTGKTLLGKFVKYIDDLIVELNTSSVNFVRCIKPNYHKQPNAPNERYILSQIRYLGVFQTILIRKKAFPSRKTYPDFAKLYRPLYKHIKVANEKYFTQEVMKIATDNRKEYMLGLTRVYMSKPVSEFLYTEYIKYLRIRTYKTRKIQQFVRKRFARHRLLVSLTLLVQRIKLFKKMPVWLTLHYNRITFEQIKHYALWRHCYIEQQQYYHRNQELLTTKKKRYEYLKYQLQFKQYQSKNNLSKLFYQIYQTLYKLSLRNGYTKLQSLFKSKYPNYNNFYIDPSQYYTYKVYNYVIDIRSPYRKLYTPSNTLINHYFKFNEYFLKYIQTVKPKTYGVLFEDCFYIPPFAYTNPNLEKLKSILSYTYVSYKTANYYYDYLSPASYDCNFTIADVDEADIQLILQFPVYAFFNKILRQRTNFLGMRKNYSDILTSKQKQLTKSMTPLYPYDYAKAIYIFSIILKIGHYRSKIETVIHLVKIFIQRCSKISQSLRNYIFVQIIRQSHSTDLHIATRMYQLALIFLHIANPPSDFILAFLHLLFDKVYDQKRYSPYRSFSLYLFAKLIKKMKKNCSVAYTPIDYQIMGIMCKRQISFPVYLPVGTSVLLRSYSNQSFSDIKIPCLTTFGIDITRFKPDLFTFFYLVSFESYSLYYSPIKYNSLVWDIFSYWYLCKKKYAYNSTPPPTFYLMVKIRLPFQVQTQDEEAVYLVYAQCFFDVFMNKIVLNMPKMLKLATYIRLIRYNNNDNVKDILSKILPFWISKRYPNKLIDKLDHLHKAISYEHLTTLELKIKFLELCNYCPMAMATTIPTEPQLTLMLKPRVLYIVYNRNIVEYFPLNHLVQWSMELYSFTFVAISKEGKQENRTHVIFTDYASICYEFLNLVSQNKICATFKKDRLGK